MSDRSKEFSDLLAQSNQALFQFLKTEIELGLTFAGIAEHYRKKANAELHQANKKYAMKALETIDRFKCRLYVPHLYDIEAGRSRLEKRIAEL
jgi:hypothetical protein